jgi:hypothetical protein
MATKPTTVPNWADTGTKVEPSSGKKATGWEYEEKPPFEYFNWWMNLIGLWCAYLDDLGSSDITNDSAIPGLTITDALASLDTAINTLDASDIDNDSYVPGSTVKDALDTLSTSDGISNGSGIPGITVSAALITLDMKIDDLDASDIDNDSGVPGSTVKDALDDNRSEIVNNANSITNNVPIGFIRGLGLGYVKNVDQYRIYAKKGRATDEDSSYMMILETLSIFEKEIIVPTGDAFASPWQASSGSTVNGVPSGVGSIGVGWLHVFIIGKSSTGDTDIGVDDNVVATNLLSESGYDKFRRIGSIYIMSAGGGKYKIREFTQVNDSVIWHSREGVLSSTLPPGSFTSYAATAAVPPGVNTKALCLLRMFTNSIATNDLIEYIDGAVPIASIVAGFELRQYVNNATVGALWNNVEAQLLTDKSQNVIHARTSFGSPQLDLYLRGYVDFRGKEEL